MLSEPQWLILLLPLIWFVFAYKPESKRILTLRIILVVLLSIALSTPLLNIPGKEGIVMFVADRSASMPKDNDKRISETLNILRSKMPSNSRLGLVSFSDKGKIEFSPSKNEASAISLEQNAGASNLADGLNMALTMIPNEMSGRIVLCSDGMWNGDNPNRVAVAALNNGIPIDYRFMSREQSNDLAISYFRVPPNLEPNENFIMKAGILSPIPQEVTLELLGGNQSIFKSKRQLKAGLNEISFNVKAPKASVIKYVLKVHDATNDAISENNTAQAVAMVRGKKPVLVVCNSEDSAMNGLLKANSIEAVLRHPRDFYWGLDLLSGYSAVVLEDVSANDIGLTGMANLSAWVKEMGGGLLVTGGKNSYGVGGYYQSPLEEILPVTMEMRSETRKMNIAMAIVLDRSGSMSMQSGGRTKMDLANLGAATSLDLLSDRDEFCLFAVDTNPHLVVPLQEATNKGAIKSKILTVDSMGGGIYVYEGIKAALEALKYANAKTRHIILFADASDAEKPGQYWELLEEAEKHNTTLSVIGLGKETDCDGPLLKKIANSGRGNIYFTSNAQELPRLFAQDTFMAAKSTFIEDKTNIFSNSKLKSYVGCKTTVKSWVNGFNICYLKPEAYELIRANNEDESPILSAHQFGLGRVACFAGVLNDKFGGAFAKSEEAAQILCQITNWLAFDDRFSVDEMVITQKIVNGKWTVYLNLDPERGKDPFKKTPKFSILSSQGGQPPKHFTLAANWETADRLSISHQLKGNEVISALLTVDDSQQLRLAPACQIYSPEFMPQNNRWGEEELKLLANMTGGRELIDLTSVWDTMPLVYQNKDISNYLFALALVIFLLEIAERRTALISIILSKVKVSKNAVKEQLERSAKTSVEVLKRETKTVKKAATLITDKASEGKPSEEKKETKGFVSALKAAKEKADRRTK